MPRPFAMTFEDADAMLCSAGTTCLALHASARSIRASEAAFCTPGDCAESHECQPGTLAFYFSYFHGCSASSAPPTLITLLVARHESSRQGVAIQEAARERCSSDFVMAAIAC